LSTTYNVIAGDTFDLIARKKYGTETEAGRISRANPGVVEPLAPGVALVIRNFPDAPKDLPQETADNDINENAVLINRDPF